MGFYVNLMMPNDCPMCPFAHYDMFNTFRGCDITRGKRWAVTNDKDYAESSTRPDWCPLIEVPEPHGRLIDADALLKEAEVPASLFPFGWKERFEVKTHAVALGDVIDAPTVIPASEEAE